MEYKKITFFEKYNIEPNLEKEKIRGLFQTNPNKRKDLPVVIKVISSDEKLFEEELFTIHKDNEKFKDYNKILEILNSTKNGYIGSEIEELSKKIKILISKDDFYENFFYSKKIPIKKTKSIYIEFINCILDKITHEFYSSIGEIKDNELKKMYICITDIFEKNEEFENKKEELDDELCDILNNSLTLDTTGKDFIKRINSLIYLNKYIKNEFYTNSIKYIIEKMSSNLNKYGNVLIEIYEQLCKSLKVNDLKESSKFITSIISDNLCLKGEKSEEEYKKCYKNLKSVQHCAYLYQKNKSVQDEDKDFDTYSQLCDYLVYAGEDWYSDYKKAYNDFLHNLTPSNMYKLISLITTKKPTDEVLRVFANVITDATHFMKIIELIAERHKDFVDKKSKEYINPFEIDEIIAMFYWLSYTNYDENITKDFFDRIREIGFDVLMFTDVAYNDLQNNNLSIYYREQLRDAVLKFYELLPGDWRFADGVSVRGMFYKIGKTFTGKNGQSNDMIEKYDILFEKLKKEIKNSTCCPECGYYVEENDEKCPKCCEKLECLESNVDEDNDEVEEDNDEADEDNHEADEDNHEADEDNYKGNHQVSARESFIVIVLLLIFLFILIVMSQ